MNDPTWFRPRGYLHLDVPVGAAYAGAINSNKVSRHKWSPLIHFIKKDKRYKPSLKKTVVKPRPIMFASHRDACILAKYSASLVSRLDKWYADNGLDETVIAYRPLGKANYNFAEQVQQFVRSHSTLTVMCFDVTGFFDNLDHSILKERLKWILDCDELPDDWYKIFRYMTHFKFVELEDLKMHSHLAKRLKARGPHPLITMRELKELGIPIRGNTESFGIPQGTPISASLSNLYLAGFDLEMAAEISLRSALYQRYSDDILVACDPAEADSLEKLVEEGLSKHRLALQKAKTERVTLAGLKTLSFQYLGYHLGHGEATLRHKSLSKQWRTARRALRKTERIGRKAILAGKAQQIYTRKLRLRLTEAGARNFLSYADRSADALKSKGIKRQAKKLRRFVHRELNRMSGASSNEPAQ